MTPAPLLCAATDAVLVREGDDIVVFDLLGWDVTSRTRVGPRLAVEIETWNDLPEGDGEAAKRAAVLARLGPDSALGRAIRPVAPDDRAVSSAAVRRARDFARWSAAALPLPHWHRLALGRYATFVQQHVAWGVPGASAALPHLRMREVAADDALVPGREDVHLIDALRVPATSRRAFEEEAAAAETPRLLFGDDGDVLRIGPSAISIGSRLDPAEGGTAVPLHPLAVALLDRELLLVCPRIAGALTEDASVSLGKVFALSWSTLAAEEERVRTR